MRGRSIGQDRSGFPPWGGIRPRFHAKNADIGIDDPYVNPYAARVYDWFVAHIVALRPFFARPELLQFIHPYIRMNG